MLHDKRLRQFAGYLPPSGTAPIRVQRIANITGHCGSNSARLCTISLEHAQSRLFTVMGNGVLRLERLTVRGGDTKWPITNRGEEGKGGAVLVQPGGALVMSSVTMENNSATVKLDSLGACNLPKLVLNGITRAPQDGGAVYLNDAMYARFKNCTFRNNKATGRDSLLNLLGRGGGVAAWDCVTTVTECEFYNNIAEMVGATQRIGSSSLLWQAISHPSPNKPKTASHSGAGAVPTALLLASCASYGDAPEYAERPCQVVPIDSTANRLHRASGVRPCVARLLRLRTVQGPEKIPDDYR